MTYTAIFNIITSGDLILLDKMIGPDHFIAIGNLFIILTLVAIAYILLISVRREKFRQQKKAIKQAIEPFISDSILRSMEDTKDLPAPELPQDIAKLCQNSYNRKIITRELMLVRKNFSGEVGQNIQLLYEQLNLNKDSEKKLHSYRWHIQAKGVQELSLMQQKQHWKKIYRLTNDRNSHVRMEAQAAIIRLLGFMGLRFLNEASYHITEWQQMNLLHLLQELPAGEFKGVERWFRSSNNSVIVFALKLAAIFRKYELHDLITDCLRHPSPAVRLQAVKTLGEIYQEDTHTHIIASYSNGDTGFRLQALRSLARIGAEESVPFLAEQTNAREHTIRFAAAKALLEISEEATAVLQEKALGDETGEWNTIIAQLKNEMK